MIPLTSRILRTSGLCSGVFLFTATIGLAKIHAAEPAPEKAEPFDVLYLSDARPIVLRLHITSDGQPLQGAWDRFADALFAKLDIDKNGTVDEKELSRLRPILALLAGQIARMPANLESALGTMTRSALGEYLKKNELGPLRLPIDKSTSRGRVRRLGAPTPVELDKALLELLDTNKDGKISVAEFTAGVEILSKLDSDENELIGMDEVLRRPQSPYFVQDADDVSQAASPGVELLPLSRKGKDTELARRMLLRYGPKPKGGATRVRIDPDSGQAVATRIEPTVRRLTKKDLKMSGAMFATLDQDGDDEVDSEELARFGQHAQPEVEIAIRLGNLAKGLRPAEVFAEGKSSLKVFASPNSAGVVIEVPGVRLDLMLPSTSFVGSKSPPLSVTYLRRFRDLDRDANGYLDMKEAASDPLFRDLFSFFDKDGDGKIFEKELTAVLDEVDQIASFAAASGLSIELNESSRGLFGIIDANGDGKLSIRELRAMPKLVERFGSNNNGGLAPVDIPRRFEALLSPGIGVGRVSLAPQAVRIGGPNSLSTAQVGPLWFQKMDRNRDGDVSRREFLGTDEEFRKLDLDGDGLISVQEAKAIGK